METNRKKRDSQVEREQPGDMASFNNRDKKRSAETEGATSKDNSNSLTDGGSNPDQTGAARTDDKKK